MSDLRPIRALVSSTSFRVCFGVALFAVFLYATDFTSALGQLDRSDAASIGLALALLLIADLLGGASLALLFPAGTSPRNIPHFIAGYLRALSLKIVLPGRSGDVVLAHEYRAWSPAAATLGRCISHHLISLAVLVVVCAYAVYAVEPLRARFLGAFAAWFLGVVLGGIATAYVVRQLRLRALQKVREIAARVMDPARAVFTERPSMAGADALINVVRLVLVGLATVVLFDSLGVQIGILYPIVVSGVATLAAMIPITYMGLGISEGIAIWLYGIGGIEPGVVMALAILVRGCRLFLLGTYTFLWLHRASAPDSS